MTLLKTAALVAGQKVRLSSFGEADLAYCKRLFAFGLARGVEAQVVRRAPLGSPIQLDVRGTAIMLRPEEASELMWEQV